MECTVDSFIYPLVCELLKLIISMSIYDILSKSFFAFHTSFGNIPTISMPMYTVVGCSKKPRGGL